MRLNKFKEALLGIEKVSIKLPNGDFVPKHFHITEVGEVQKKFVDCGGTIRNETKVNFQLWSSTDTWHGLSPKKILDIIELSEKKLSIGNYSIEVEYQGDTIQKYGIEFRVGVFELEVLNTDCLAKDKCGIPKKKPKIKLSQLKNGECSPNNGCC